MKKIIVVLEDEYLLREEMRRFLSEKFPTFSTRFLKTELEFHAALPELLAAPPSLALLGVRVKWTSPAPVMPTAPAEILAGGFRKAGFRCWKMLRQYQSTKQVPVIFYTSINECGNAEQDILADPLTSFVEREGTDRWIIKKMREMLQDAKAV